MLKSPCTSVCSISNCASNIFMVLPFVDGFVEREFSSISYESATGHFRWINPAKKARGVSAGDLAGYVMGSGYRRISINGKTVLAHRLAWAFTYGRWPSGQIDHINGDRADNRIVNLRDVPHLINAQNRRAANRNNATGFLGVSKTRDRYMATICIGSKKEYIGTFDTAEEAHIAYRRVKVANHEGCTL